MFKMNLGLRGLRAFGLCLLAAMMPAMPAFAQTINPSDITVSTNLETLIDFDVAKISDGVTITPSPEGFVAAEVVASNGHGGWVDFRFSKAANITGIDIWNGIDGPIQGFQTVRFEFFNANDVNIYDSSASPINIDTLNPGAQSVGINAAKAQNTRRVRMHLGRTPGVSMGMNEVTFKGSLVSPSSTPSSIPWPLIGMAAALLAGGGLVAARLLKRGKSPVSAAAKPVRFTRSMLQKPERHDRGGVVFAGSPMVAGAASAGPAALAPAGQMIPSGLQTLTGPYAALKPAYMATGRIGGPQEGVPTNNDVAFGTGFLVTPNHVMTNQHVYEFYKHYLTGKDCGGIEFIAERDRDASDYIPFNGEPPMIFPDMDIAIFTLARPAAKRTPIARVSVPTQDLDGQDVITVSYPCPFETDETMLSVVEEDPIFAVKRLSQGKVFRHSTDTDTPYGVRMTVDSRINPSGSMDAICHNASTLGGSSGAPILTADGQLVGVHFAGDRAFNGKEAANLAMAIEALVAATPPE